MKEIIVIECVKTHIRQYLKEVPSDDPFAPRMYREINESDYDEFKDCKESVYIGLCYDFCRDTRDILLGGHDALVEYLKKNKKI